MIRIHAIVSVSVSHAIVSVSHTIVSVLTFFSVNALAVTPVSVNGIDGFVAGGRSDGNITLWNLAKLCDPRCAPCVCVY